LSEYPGTIPFASGEQEVFGADVRVVELRASVIAAPVLFALLV
jgi:hypothetical protein